MYILAETLRTLDEWVAKENVRSRSEGLATHHKSTVRLLGQAALWASDTGLSLTVTQDVDAYTELDWAVQKEFERLLKEQGVFLDPQSAEVWMPCETNYVPIYEGTNVFGYVADVDAVLVSKALKAPAKNKALIIEYLANGASDRFMMLAKKYKVDLETFL